MRHVWYSCTPVNLSLVVLIYLPIRYSPSKFESGTTTFSLTQLHCPTVYSYLKKIFLPRLLDVQWERTTTGVMRQSQVDDGMEWVRWKPNTKREGTIFIYIHTYKLRIYVYTHTHIFIFGRIYIIHYCNIWILNEETPEIQSVQNRRDSFLFLKKTFKTGSLDIFSHKSNEREKKKRWGLGI